MKTKSIEERVEELVEDFECRGRYCLHETTEEHYILTKNEIIQALKDQRQEIVEMIEKEVKEYFFNSDSRTLEERIVDLINTLNK